MNIPTHANNLFNIHIDSLIDNAGVNFGDVIHKGYAANAESVGGQTDIGDFSPGWMMDVNLVRDANVLDQPQTQI